MILKEQNNQKKTLADGVLDVNHEQESTPSTNGKASLWASLGRLLLPGPHVHHARRAVGSAVAWHSLDLARSRVRSRVLMHALQSSSWCRSVFLKVFLSIYPSVYLIYF